MIGSSGLDTQSASAAGRRTVRSQSPQGESRPAKASKTSSKNSAAVSTTPPLLVVQVGSPSSYQHGLSGGIQKPTQLATFSYDESRGLHHDDRSRKYYHAPPRQADLNRGFDRLIERDDTVNEHLDSLLASLMRLGGANNEAQADNQSDAADQNRQQAHVITWRGMMTRLCTMLYEGRDGFEMNLMMVGQTLYIEEHKTPKQNTKPDDRLRRFGYYGYSFESYTCHSWRTWQQSGTEAWDGDVNTNVQWCSVVKTRLGPHRLLIGGEVDAVDPQTNEPVEVKTSMQIRNARDEERFETKMLRFYMQSFLLGVQKVVVGFRDSRGVLMTHQEMDTLGMPRAVRGKPHAWDPMACLGAASEILATVRASVDKSTIAAFVDGLAPHTKEAGSSAVYPVFRLRYTPTSFATGQKELSVRQLSADEILHEVKGGSDTGRVGFLPSKYYDFARRRLS